MASDIHFQKLMNMYARAASQDAFTREIRVEEGKASLVLPVKPEYFHAAGAVHGHVYFKVMDDTAFFAAASLEEQFMVVTATFQVYFTRPINKGSLHASAEAVHRSRNLVIADAVIRDDDGKQIARGSGSFMRSKVPLDEKIGYGL